MRFTIALLLAGLVAALAGCMSERAAGPPPAAGGECTVPLNADVLGGTFVAIKDFAFSPEVLRVKAGTKVTWVYCEPPETAGHTSTADGGNWNSPLLSSGGTYSRTFDQPGTFAYHCEPHPYMTATLIVE